jgi:hypothetical protein
MPGDQLERHRSELGRDGDDCKHPPVRPKYRGELQLSISTELTNLPRQSGPAIDTTGVLGLNYLGGICAVPREAIRYEARTSSEKAAERKAN